MKVTSKELLGALRIIRAYERSIARSVEDSWVIETPQGLMPRDGLSAGLESIEAILRYAASCLDFVRYGKEVDDCVAGNLNRYTAIMIRRDTPSTLQKIGCANLPWLHTQLHLRNELHPKSPSNRSWHGLPLSTLKALPELLENPCVVLDNPANKTGLVCVLNQTDAEGMPMIMPFAPNGRGSYLGEELLTNFVLSVYGREGFAQYLKNAAEQDRILYFDAERTRKLMSFAGLELPGACMSFNGIIHPSRQIVKTAEIQSQHRQTCKQEAYELRDGGDER